MKGFVVDKNIFVESGPIKHQASENNFYGESDKLNASIESFMTVFLKRIDKRKITYSKKGLNRFVQLLTHLDLRNPIRMEGFKAQVDNVRDSFLKETSEGRYDDVVPWLDKSLIRQLVTHLINDRTPKMREDMTPKLILAVHKIAGMMHDVKVKLIENYTSSPFITSDHPTVVYNQFFEKNGLGNINGYGNKGVQMFLPVDSKCLILIYDHKIYNVGVFGINKVKITDDRDVDQLNLLQMYNSINSVYGNEMFTKPYALHLKRLMSIEKSRAENTMCIDRIDLKLNFIALKRIARHYCRSGGFNQLRDNGIGYQDIFGQKSTRAL